MNTEKKYNFYRHSFIRKHYDLMKQLENGYIVDTKQVLHHVDGLSTMLDVIAEHAGIEVKDYTHEGDE